MNRAQRRYLDANARRAGARGRIRTRLTTWARNDALWFKANRDRSHRVRPRLANEWFAELSDAPGLDLVVIRQIEPGARIRIPFTLPLSPCREWLREAATTEAGAHTLFDLTQQGEREVFVIDYATLLADWDLVFEIMRGRDVQPPFDVTPIFLPGYLGDTCPLFVITRETGGLVNVMSALPVKNSGQLFWSVPDSVANKEIADQLVAAALATIEARNLKPIGVRR